MLSKRIHNLPLASKQRVCARVFAVLGLGAALSTSPALISASSSPPPDAGGVVLLDRLAVTTATRSWRLISDTPVRTEVLLSEDIAMRGTANFSQAIELINGVRVESNCQNCNTSEAQLLGMGGAYSQILFDGMPLLPALGRIYGLEQIPAPFVDRLEIVKGGGSALYGPDAVAGVINLVPAAPRGNGGFVQACVEVQHGTPLHIADGRADFASAGGKFAMSIVGQGVRNDAIDLNRDNYTEITEKQLGVAGVMIWLKPCDRTTLHANYQFTRENRRGGNRLDQPEYLANIAESLRTKYHRGALTWEQHVSGDFDFRAGYSFTSIDRKSFYGGLGDVVTDPSAPGYDPAQLDPNVPGGAASASANQYGATVNPLHYIDAQFNWSAGTHALAAGAQYKRESVRDENRDYLGETLRIAVDETFSNIGVFVQDEWDVTGALQLVISARADKSSALDDPVFSPRVAATFIATVALKLRASISTGFRSPDIFSEDLHVETLGAEQVRIRNVPGLTAEHACTYTAGFEWRPATARWALDATASFTDLNDTFVLGDIQTAADGSFYQSRSNASGSRIGGAEINIVTRPVSTIEITAGLAYYRSRYDEPQIVFDDTGDGGTTVMCTRNYLKTPEWSALAQATWTPDDDWEMFAGLKYTGPMFALNNNAAELRRTSDFWVVDLGITRHIALNGGGHDGGPHLDVYVGVKNLFDERQRDLESGPTRDSTYVYGPRAPRSFYGGVRYSF